MFDITELNENDLVFDVYSDAIAALKSHLVEDAGYSPEEALIYIDECEIELEEGSVYSEMLDRYYVWSVSD